MTALWFGGRHDLGRAVYIFGVLLACCGWLAVRCSEGPRSRPTRAYLILAAAVFLVGLQVFPLPHALLTSASPQLERYLPAWFGGAHAPSLFGSWATVSLTPGESTFGLAILIAHAALFVVVLQRLQRLDDLWAGTRFLACVSLGMSVVGVVQWLSPNGRLLWFYEHPVRDFGEHVQGSFANRNHFAHFVTLGLPAMAVLAAKSVQEQSKAERRPARQSRRTGTNITTIGACLSRWGWPAAFAVSIAAVLLAESRGVLVMLGVTLTLAALLMVRCRLLAFRRRSGPLIVAGLAVAAGAIVVVGAGLLSDTARLTSALGDGSFASQSGRGHIWRANAEAFAESPWLGWGVGSHRFVYRLFLDAPIGTEFTHAESGYLQIATETGLAGLTLLVAAVALIASWSCRVLAAGDREIGALSCVFFPPVVGGFVHAVVDFAWYVPACMALSVFLSAGLLRLHQLTSPAPPAADPPVSVETRPTFVFPAALSIFAAVAFSVYLGPAVASTSWDHYGKISRAMQSYAEHDVRAAPDEVLRHRATQRHFVAEMLATLSEVARYNPNHIEARLQLCARNRQMFDLTSDDADNPVSASGVRDAALQSGFTSYEDTVEWVSAAFGERGDYLTRAHRHATLAKNLCPLAGRPYLALAELSLFSPPVERDNVALIDQALAVRPFYGPVLFEAGRLSQQEGLEEQARDLWRRCCRYPGSQRQTLVALVCGLGVPAENFLAEIEPPAGVFAVAARFYARFGRPSDLAALADYGTRIANDTGQQSTGRDVSRLWISIAQLYEQLGRPEKAISAAESARRLAPNDFWIRYRVAQLLIELGLPKEAAAHVRWCLARRPDMTHLRRALVTARRDASRPAADAPLEVTRTPVAAAPINVSSRIKR